jgi:hypothetical protein
METSVCNTCKGEMIAVTIGDSTHLMHPWEATKLSSQLEYNLYLRQIGHTPVTPIEQDVVDAIYPTAEVIPFPRKSKMRDDSISMDMY